MNTRSDSLYGDGFVWSLRRGEPSSMPSVLAVLEVAAWAATATVVLRTTRGELPETATVREELMALRGFLEENPDVDGGASGMQILWYEDGTCQSHFTQQNGDDPEMGMIALIDSALEASAVRRVSDPALSKVRKGDPIGLL